MIPTLEVKWESISKGEKKIWFNCAFSQFSFRTGIAHLAEESAIAVSVGSETGGVQLGSLCTWQNTMALGMCMLTWKGKGWFLCLSHLTFIYVSY